jgi:hypothetical protein
MRERRRARKILVGKPDRKGSLGRLRRRCEDSILMGFQEIGWELRVF